MGRQRVRARLRRLPAPRRPRGRPARTQAPVPVRRRRVHDCVAPQRPRVVVGRADRLARASGARRRLHLARCARDHHDDVRGGSRAVEGARRVGGDRFRRRGGRARARRRAHAGVLVAVDLLHQRPRRDHRVRALGSPDPGVARRAGGAELRRGGGGHGDGRPDAARLRDREHAAEGMDVGVDARYRGRRVRPAHRVRRDRAPGHGAARAARHLPHSHAHHRERRDAARRVRTLRNVLFQLAVHSASSRIRPARGGARVPSVHRRES